MMSPVLGMAILWPVGIFLLALSWRKRQQNVTVGKRLDMIRKDLGLGVPDSRPSKADSVGKATSSTKLNFRERWARGPQAAALRLRVSEYILIRIGSFIVPFLLGIAIRGIIEGLVLGVVGIGAVTFYFHSKQRKWLIRAEESLPDFLRGVANALRAGSSLSQSIALVAKDTVDPLGSELRRVLRRENIGFSLVDALQELTRRIPSKDLALATLAITIQREVGGSLADLLDNITTTIVERQRLKTEVRIITTQGRYSGMVLTALPFILGIVLWLTGPSYFQPMFHTELGWILVGAACVSVAIGGFLINRLVKAPEM